MMILITSRFPLEIPAKANKAVTEPAPPPKKKRHEGIVGVEGWRIRASWLAVPELLGQRLDVPGDPAGYVHEYGDTSATRTPEL